MQSDVQCQNGADGFCISDIRSVATGGIFFTDSVVLPEISEKAKGIKGIYSEHGLTTYRLNSARYAPSRDKVLKVDVFCDSTCEMAFTLEDAVTGEMYRVYPKRNRRSMAKPRFKKANFSKR